MATDTLATNLNATITTQETPIEVEDIQPMKKEVPFEIPDAFWEKYLWVPLAPTATDAPTSTSTTAPKEKGEGGAKDEQATPKPGADMKVVEAKDDATEDEAKKDVEAKDGEAKDEVKADTKEDDKTKADGKEEDSEEVPTFRFTSAVLGELNDVFSLAFSRAEASFASSTPMTTPDSTASSAAEETKPSDTTSTETPAKTTGESSTTTSTDATPDAELKRPATTGQMIVLKSPHAQGAHVLDQAIRTEATKMGVEVLVLDPFEISKGRFGSLGEAGRVIDEIYESRKHMTGEERKADEEKRGKDAPEMLKRTRAFWDALLFGGPTAHVEAEKEEVAELSTSTESGDDVGSSEASKDSGLEVTTTTTQDDSKTRRRRIIYLRDFHRISPVAKPLLAYIVDALQRHEDPEYEAKEEAILKAEVEKKAKEEAEKKAKEEEEKKAKEEEEKKAKETKEAEEKKAAEGEEKKDVEGEDKAEGDKLSEGEATVEGEKANEGEVEVEGERVSDADGGVGEALPTPPPESEEVGEVKEGSKEEAKQAEDPAAAEGEAKDKVEGEKPKEEEPADAEVPKEDAPGSGAITADEEVEKSTVSPAETQNASLQELSSSPPPAHVRPSRFQSTIILIGTNQTIDNLSNEVGREAKENCLFFNSLFLQVRSEWAWKYMSSSCKCSVCSPTSCMSESVTLHKVTVPTRDEEWGKRVDDVWGRRLAARAFAANVKYEQKDAKWQEKAKERRFEDINRTVFDAVVEKSEPWAKDEAMAGVTLDGLEPNTILEVHEVERLLEIVSATRAVNAGNASGSESGKSSAQLLKERLDQVYQNIQQGKKDRTTWESGIDPTEEKDDKDPEEEAKRKKTEEEDKLFEGLSSYAQGLRGSVVNIDDISTTFSDVFVDKSTVDSLQTIVSLPLLFPHYFNSGVLAKEAIGGILLYGPPGTGKTMLCRALAKTCHARMLHIQPSDINDKYVGEAEKNVAAVFEVAHKLAPCIIFIDEIDALFSARTSCTRTWERNILTEFMMGMDGLKSAKKNRDNRVVVVGATNRPFDLDLAVLRRMPRRIMVDMPNMEMRTGILKSYLKDETLDEGVNLDRLALETAGFSGSDLKNLCVAAALASVKDAIGTNWQDRELPKPPTAEEKSKTSKAGVETKDKTEAPPPRTISAANILQARSEIVRSVTGSRGDELYKWHQQHSGRAR